MTNDDQPRPAVPNVNMDQPITVPVQVQTGDIRSIDFLAERIGTGEEDGLRVEAMRTLDGGMRIRAYDGDRHVGAVGVTGQALADALVAHLVRMIRAAERGAEARR